MKISPKNTKVCSSCSKEINTDFNASFKMATPQASKKPTSSKIVSIINPRRAAQNSKTQSLF